MSNKDRTLVVLKYLQDCSNDRTSVTTRDIRSEVEQNELHTNMLTLRRDIQAIRDAGFDVHSFEQSGLMTEYNYMGRYFAPADLMILVDAVASAQFLSPEMSRKMIDKMKQYAGPGYEEELEPFIAMSGRCKAQDDMTLAFIRYIRQAIREDKRVSFRYMVDDVDQGRIPKHEGQRYHVSPYATVWKEDRYYLVGYSEKHEAVATFRIDRIAKLSVLETKRREPPEDYCLQDYVDQAFRMYGKGEKATVTLRCRKELYGQILDQFGDRTKVTPLDDEWMKVTADVILSGTFYSWVFQYPGDMQITGPEKAVKEYRERLRIAMGDAK